MSASRVFLSMFNAVTAPRTRCPGGGRPCFCHSAQNAETRGRPALRGIFDLLFDFQKIHCGSINLVSRQLNFKGSPVTIGTLAYGIDFLIFVILIMIQPCVK